MEYVNHHVRTKLDELKRTELQRLRELVKQAEELDHNQINQNHIDPGHLDHQNPHTFESADLHKLITQVHTYPSYIIQVFILNMSYYDG